MEVSRAPRPVQVTQAVPLARCRGNSRRIRRAGPTGKSRTGSISLAATDTSAKPRTQRSGSGTLRSTTAPSRVSTISSSGPTDRRKGSPSPSRARAVRMGLFTSTLVVPQSENEPSIAAASRSKRA